MIDLTPEQKKAYDRYIAARNKVGLVRTKGFSKMKWVPISDFLGSVDVMGVNHPYFELNEPWLEYKEAFMSWLAVEPKFREQERMRMSRGDYGTQDSWDEKKSYVSDTYKKIKEE
jgi:hypothetical protein